MDTYQLKTRRLQTAAIRRQIATARAERTARIKVVCLECGKKFQVRVYANECPKCGGTDIEVRE
jgi:Zn finger protein HypA/HybF involved in hydrogenase expression